MNEKIFQRKTYFSLFVVPELLLINSKNLKIASNIILKEIILDM